MNRSRTLVLLSALALAGLGAACGSGGEAAPQNASRTQAGGSTGGSGDAITVTAKEFSYEPKDITLQAGKATKIALKNAGAVEHDITLDSPAFKLAAQPTKSGEAQLTIPTAGSYTYYCSVPGHRQAGMEGSVTVS